MLGLTFLPVRLFWFVYIDEFSEYLLVGFDYWGSAVWVRYGFGILEYHELPY